MKVSYIISAYRLPELLVRLVRRLDAPAVTYHIHVDARTPDDVYHAMADPLRDMSNVNFLSRHACHWGDFGHVEATLKGLTEIVASGASDGYAVLLTGQDYPLVAPDRIAARLAAARGTIFMQHFALPTERWSDRGMDRIEQRQFHFRGRLARFPGRPFGHAALDGAWLRAARRLRLLRSFPADLRPWGGSSYWCMPLDCVSHVVDFVERRPQVVDFFRRTMIPDEMLFQTIVMNSPYRDRVEDDDLRFIDWSGDGDSPAILTADRFDELMASGRLFARKFDPTVDADVLDRIDAAIEDG